MKKVKRFGRKKIHRAQSFEVVSDRVLWPNGKILKRDLVLHGGISVILPLLDENQMVLVRQYRYGADQMLWELPAGTIARRETPLQCARREIVEEVGYRAGQWKKIADIYTSPGYNTEKVFCFLAQKLTPAVPHPEDDEILTVKVFSCDQVRKMVQRRVIRDAKSLLALFYFWEMRP
ncbi:MAG: NUDIX hydrolase [Candidatus Omnitrophota bacterium]|jgi:ADP-ribose pyrophosphatase